MTQFAERERYMVVSADGHAGADIMGYRPYLDAKWHDFDAWAQDFNDPWIELDPGFSGKKLGICSGVTPTNWDSDARESDLRTEGIVGEVIFPNTSPPFFPSGVITAAEPKSRAEYERRVAGLRAHNRWLVDFCGALPGRRAGVTQVFLNDIADTVAEVQWAREAGLSGGVLIPQVDPANGLPQLHSPAYESLWSACEDLDIPVAHHGFITWPTDDGDFSPINRLIASIDTPFYSIRMLWQLIMSGVFERHPRLRFVMTEVPLGWVPGRLDLLDSNYAEAQIPGSRMRSLHGEAFAKLSMKPSDYFRRNCKIGVSFMLPTESPIRDDVGVESIMWGADYPHSEGTAPFTREALRATFCDVPAEECRAMFGETAASFYNLDVDKMRTLANEYGPTVEEIAIPLVTKPRMPDETSCHVFEDHHAKRY